MAPSIKGLNVERTHETHISWVLLTPDEAYKLKKPVNFGFLDFSAPKQRKAACFKELDLNRRLAPDVYLDVVSLGRDEDGLFVPVSPESDAAVEWAVRMQRLRDADRVHDRLARGVVTVDDVDRIAETIAHFHATCRPAAPEFGRPELVFHNIRENFAQADDCPGVVLGIEAALETEAWQLDWMRDHVDRLRERTRSGFVRDGHGDLRLEHVYLTEAGVRIIDCIEFNERFRFADVAADLAFLSMDFARVGRPELAERLLAAYARRYGDYDLYSVIDFYESYRAFVRGKISCLSIAGNPDSDHSDHLRHEARNYFLMAQSVSRPPLVPPRVVAVGGLIGAGKSTVADALSLALGAPSIEADRTRKQLVGAEPTEDISGHPGAYGFEMTERVYDTLIDRAARVLSSGRSVVVDATFRTEALRTKARDLAHRFGLPFQLVECVAPEAELRRRLVARAASRASTASDAGPDLLDSFMAGYEAPAPSDALFRLDTTGSIDEVRARATRTVLDRA